MYDFEDNEILDIVSGKNIDRKNAYICSPLFDEAPEKLKDNMEQARLYMKITGHYMKVSAKAPHAYLPMLLCDRKPYERALAIKFGLELLEQCEMLLVCGDRLSQGMKGEIRHALKLKMPIVVFNQSLYEAVTDYADELNYSIKGISHNSDYVGLEGPAATLE